MRVMYLVCEVSWWVMMVVFSAVALALLFIPDFRAGQVLAMTRWGIEPGVFYVFMTMQLLALLRARVKFR